MAPILPSLAWLAPLRVREPCSVTIPAIPDHQLDLFYASAQKFRAQWDRTHAKAREAYETYRKQKRYSGTNLPPGFEDGPEAIEEQKLRDAASLTCQPVLGEISPSYDRLLQAMQFSAYRSTGVIDHGPGRAAYLTSRVDVAQRHYSSDPVLRILRTGYCETQVRSSSGGAISFKALDRRAFYALTVLPEATIAKARENLMSMPTVTGGLAVVIQGQPGSVVGSDVFDRVFDKIHTRGNDPVAGVWGDWFTSTPDLPVSSFTKARIQEQQDLCSWSSLKNLVVGVLAAEFSSANCEAKPASIAEANQLLLEAAELAYRISESERTVEVRSGNAASAREAKAKMKDADNNVARSRNCETLLNTLKAKGCPLTRSYLTRNGRRVMTSSQLGAVLAAYPNLFCEDDNGISLVDTPADADAVKLVAALRNRGGASTRPYLTRNANAIMTDSQLDAVLSAYPDLFDANGGTISFFKDADCLHTLTESLRLAVKHDPVTREDITSGERRIMSDYQLNVVLNVLPGLFVEGEYGIRLAAEEPRDAERLETAPASNAVQLMLALKHRPRPLTREDLTSGEKGIMTDSQLDEVLARVPTHVEEVDGIIRLRNAASTKQSRLSLNPIGEELQRALDCRQLARAVNHSGPVSMDALLEIYVGWYGDSGPPPDLRESLEAILASRPDIFKIDGQLISCIDQALPAVEVTASDLAEELRLHGPATKKQIVRWLTLTYPTIDSEWAEAHLDEVLATYPNAFGEVDGKVTSMDVIRCQEFVSRIQETVGGLSPVAPLPGKPTLAPVITNFYALRDRLATLGSLTRETIAASMMTEDQLDEVLEKHPLDFAEEDGVVFLIRGSLNPADPDVVAAFDKLTQAIRAKHEKGGKPWLVMEGDDPSTKDGVTHAFSIMLDRGELPPGVSCLWGALVEYGAGNVLCARDEQGRKIAVVLKDRRGWLAKWRFYPNVVEKAQESGVAYQEEVAEVAKVGAMRTRSNSPGAHCCRSRRFIRKVQQSPKVVAESLDIRHGASFFHRVEQREVSHGDVVHRLRWFGYNLGSARLRHILRLSNVAFALRKI